MKTAVEYIELRLLGIASFDSEELRLIYKDIIKQAKEIEKEQIIATFDNGFYSALYSSSYKLDFDGKHYYNIEYNQNK